MTLDSSLAIIIFGLVFLARAGALDPHADDADPFPGWSEGWRGKVGNDDQALDPQINPRDAIGYGSAGKEAWRGKIEQISWEPRIFLYHNFLSDEECDHLISISEDRLVESTVVDESTGGRAKSKYRTSKGTYLGKSEDPVVARIEKRLSLISMFPEENFEPIHILEYKYGEYYVTHTDYFNDKFSKQPERGGQRIATVLMYLSTPTVGGETMFPFAVGPKASGPGWSTCAKLGLSIKPKKGNAVLFYSLTPNGTEDNKSSHGSCPTEKGTKYSATTWIRVGPYHPPSDCVDKNTRCAEWAKAGQCQNDPGFMEEACAKTCDFCQKKAAASGSKPLGKAKS